MTETSFQEARKVMQTANYWRGIIIKRKGDVAKWTAIEDSHRRELRTAQADGTKKLIEKAIARLDEARAKFASIQLPDSNIVDERPKRKECQLCGTTVKDNEDYCESCITGQ